MRQLFIIATALAITVARPETYKESEDFQYSRSSSDDGTKSGYYGAQRGNMGGNYERAHNMDSLAQNQMSGLVRQVEGDLGDGANTKSGSVYSAASSRGTYGSGHHDLSNLAGRNFQEGVSLDNSQSHSSSYGLSNNANYRNRQSQSSRYSGYQAAGHTSGNTLQTDDLQSLDNSQGVNLYDYGRQSSRSSGYHSQSGFQEHNAYENRNTNSQAGSSLYDSNTQSRLIGNGVPVKIIIRPGTRVAIPVAAQTYDNSHASSSLYNQNTLNTDTELLSNQGTASKPSYPKHYESSFNYRKAWEKHDTIPSAIPTLPNTENPIPINSELNEDTQAHLSRSNVEASGAGSRSAHSYSNVKSASSQSRYRSDYDAEQQKYASGSNLNTYNNAGSTYGASDANGYSQNNAASRSDTQLNNQAAAALNTDLNSQVESLNKPKSYHSSYSYHKSWERQGDPYVIKPASSVYNDGQSSQRYTSSTKNQGYASQQSGYHAHQNEEDCDCDVNGYRRVARSYNSDDFGQQVQTNLDQQQSQNQWEKLEDLGQQTQNLEDFSQQSQTSLDQQHSQSQWDKLEDLGQQTQKLEDFSQQSQTNLDHQHSQSQSDKLEDLSQQTQNLEDFSQQSQTNLDQQQSQSHWDKLENLGQHRQSNWNQNNLGQHDQEPIYRQEADKLSQNIPKSESAVSTIQKSQDGTNDRHFINAMWDKSDSFHSADSLSKETSQQQNSFNTFSQQQQEIASNGNHRGYFNYFNHNHQESSTHQAHNHQRHHWHSYTGNSQSSQGNNNDTEIQQLASVSNLWNKLDNIDNYRSIPKFETSENSPNEPLNKKEIDKPQDNNRGDIGSEPSNEETETFADIGRGDIGPDKSHTNKTMNTAQTTETNNIDNLNPNQLSVISLEEQKLQDKNENISVSQTQYSQFHISSETHKDTHSNDYFNNNKQKLNTNNFEHNITKVSEQGTHQVVQHAHHLEQQANPEQQHLPESQHGHFDQHNFQHFGQANLDEQNLHGFEQHEYLEQQNLQDLGHTNLDQENLHGFEHHENLEQQNLQDFGQANLNQQNLHGFEQHENLEQQNLQDFGQANLDQQNLHGFDQHENLEQQNLQDFGQTNLDQQNLHGFEQHENLEQQNLQDFGQANLNQQNLHGFEQHENLEQQNLQDFGQANLDQQNLHEFDQHENLEQQNLQDFGQTNLDQQNLHGFEQHENLEQQNLQDFSHANFDQQNLHDQHENLEQQNLQDFGQTNLDEQNLHGFEKHENLEQQNLQDLDQTNLDQQSLHEFEQPEYFAHQNLGDFGQAYIDQQNLRNFGHRENLQQQNMQGNYQSNSKLHLAQDSAYQENIEQTMNKQEQIEQHYSHDTEQQPRIFKEHDIDNKESPIQKNERLKPSEINNSENATALNQTSQIEPVTEKPGFWRSVGSKFTSAKDNVVSWFKRT